MKKSDYEVTEKEDGRTRRYVKFSDYKKLIIKIPSLKEIILTHLAYISLSPESKEHFDPGFLGYPKNMSWFIKQLGLISSLSKFSRILTTKIYPKLLQFSLIARFPEQIIGFAFLHEIETSDNGLSAKLGIFIKDKFQGEEIGSILLRNLLYIARKSGMKKITLVTDKSNDAAINLYEKFDFKKISDSKDIIKMALYLS